MLVPPNTEANPPEGQELRAKAPEETSRMRGGLPVRPPFTKIWMNENLHPTSVILKEKQTFAGRTNGITDSLWNI